MVVRARRISIGAAGWWASRSGRPSAARRRRRARMGSSPEKEVPVSAIGRNQPCRCGSKKKTKHCCGVPHGPSDTELAKAFLATEARHAAPRLIGLPEDELHDIFDEMLDLPEQHLSLQLPLPKLLSPELEALRYAIDDDDTDAADHHLEPALGRVDNPRQRAHLARAVLALADSNIIERSVADAAIVDLDSHSSSAFMRTSLLHALSVSAGASRTPAGLLVVAR
jgi:hypothetical protein